MRSESLKYRLLTVRISAATVRSFSCRRASPKPVMLRSNAALLKANVCRAPAAAAGHCDAQTSGQSWLTGLAALFLGGIRRRAAAGIKLLMAVNVEEDHTDQNPRPGNAHRNPRERVPRLGAKSALPTHAPQRAGQSSAATALDEHQNGQKDRGHPQERDEHVIGKE